VQLVFERVGLANDVVRTFQEISDARLGLARLERLRARAQLLFDRAEIVDERGQPRHIVTYAQRVRELRFEFRL
jgi:hypothetical protein